MEGRKIELVTDIQIVDSSVIPTHGVILKHN